MSASKPVVDEHYESAREKLAGAAASRAWVQELAAAHLLRSEQPIRDEPIETETEEGK